MICITEHQAFGRRVTYAFRELANAKFYAENTVNAGENARITVQDDDTGETLFEGTYSQWIGL